MIAQFNFVSDREDRIRNIELRVRDICIGGTDLVPHQEDMAELYALRRELIDLTDGTNTIMFDKMGRPSPAFVIPNDRFARTDNYASMLGGSPTTYTPYWENILPCFKRSNKEISYLLIQKYRCIQHNKKNYALGLPMMKPAHSSYGFTVSYNGINSACDAVNRGSFEDGLDVHEITWDEYGYLTMRAALDGYGSKEGGWEPHGNDAWGKSYNHTSEIGAPCGPYTYESNYVHTLTGSGPNTWRHNNDITGIADLRGITRVILSGVRLLKGELGLIDFRGTTGTLTNAQLGTSSDLWKGLDTSGNLVAPSSANTYKVDYETASSNYRWNTSITTEAAKWSTGSAVSLASGVAEQPLLYYLNLLPLKGAYKLQGNQYMPNNFTYATALLSGAYWDDYSTGGLACRTGNGSFDYADHYIGALLAAFSDKLEY